MPLDEIVAANSGTAAEKAQLAAWGTLLAVGQTSNFMRQTIENIDLFVGRYLLLTTVAYVGVKFVQ